MAGAQGAGTGPAVGRSGEWPVSDGARRVWIGRAGQVWFPRGWDGVGAGAGRGGRQRRP